MTGTFASFLDLCANRENEGNSMVFDTAVANLEQKISRKRTTKPTRTRLTSRRFQKRTQNLVSVLVGNPKYGT